VTDSTPTDCKPCKQCGVTKPLDDFYRHPTARDGRRGQCKACILYRASLRYQDDPEKFKERTRLYRESNPDQLREYKRRRKEKTREWCRTRLLRQYGLDEGEFDAMAAAQGDRCAICETDTPGGAHNVWHIDHCHDTGRVRGLLCQRCNVGLGYFSDDPAVLSAAVDYLERAVERKAS
jgi:hypothetical protein